MIALIPKVERAVYPCGYHNCVLCADPWPDLHRTVLPGQPAPAKMPKFECYRSVSPRNVPLSWQLWQRLTLKRLGYPDPPLRQSSKRDRQRKDESIELETEAAQEV